MLGPTGLTRHATTFDPRDVIRAWCEELPDGAPLAELQLLSAQTIARDEVVQLATGRHTTKELLALERTIIEQAINGIGKGVAIASDQSVRAATAARPTISAEQDDLCRRLVMWGDGVSVVIAAAGTGKGSSSEPPGQPGNNQVIRCPASRWPPEPPPNCAPVPEFLRQRSHQPFNNWTTDLLQQCRVVCSNFASISRTTVYEAVRNGTLRSIRNLNFYHLHRHVPCDSLPSSPGF